MQQKPRPLMVAGFLFLLAAAQLAALGWQVASGYHPFLSNPSRVMLSWDMFTNPVERCTLNWLPALNVANQPLASLRDVLLPFEWDVIFDHVDDYKGIGQNLCQSWAVQPTLAVLHCYLPNGTEMNDGFICR